MSRGHRNWRFCICPLSGTGLFLNGEVSPGVVVGGCWFLLPLLGSWPAGRPLRRRGWRRGGRPRGVVLWLGHARIFRTAFISLYVISKEFRAYLVLEFDSMDNR